MNLEYPVVVDAVGLAIDGREGLGSQIHVFRGELVHVSLDIHNYKLVRIIKIDLMANDTRNLNRLGRFKVAKLVGGGKVHGDAGATFVGAVAGGEIGEFADAGAARTDLDDALVRAGQHTWLAFAPN